MRIFHGTTCKDALYLLEEGFSFEFQTFLDSEKVVYFWKETNGEDPIEKAFRSAHLRRCVTLDEGDICVLEFEIPDDLILSEKGDVVTVDTIAITTDMFIKQLVTSVSVYEDDHLLTSLESIDNLNCEYLSLSYLKLLKSKNPNYTHNYTYRNTVPLHRLEPRDENSIGFIPANIKFSKPSKEDSNE